MKPFDAENIELKGKNLIEASAGTGKTYSIGILVLRMLLEKNIRIEQILMVTFTNAAVAELEIRIRSFLRKAHKIARNFDKNTVNTTEDSIYTIVGRAINQKGKEEVIKLLRNAILFLDETSIFTIHGFSQFTLSEYAFETGQLFNTEIIEDQSKIIEAVVNDFWRKNISVLDMEILKVLDDTGFTRMKLLDFAKDIINGKKLYVRNRIDKKEWLALVKEKQNQVEIAYSHISKLVKNNWGIIRHTSIRSTKMKDIISNNDYKGFVEKFITDYKRFEKKGEQKYVQNFEFLFDSIKNITDAESEFNDLKIEIMVNIFDDAAGYLVEEVEKRKNRNQMLSFYDLISKLHREVVINDNHGIQNKLREKYKCVFIDEFQDTDYLQYGLFKKVFVDEGNSIVFFIGDPKQSIYGWRGADLNTYINARNDIEYKYTMKSNFRSTASLIAAMNEFFPSGTCGESLESNPFCSKEIAYEEVNTANKDLAVLYKNDKPVSSFDIINHPHKSNSIDILFESTAKEVLDLLHTGYFDKDNVKTRVKPDNIGILVRSNKETKKMKKLLLKYNVPAIITDETKVMETDEAKDLYYVIFAIINPDNSSISRALLTSFTGFTTEIVANQDLDYHKSLFLELQKNWKSSGIYSAVLSFIKNYDIRKYLLDKSTGNGYRIYSNLMQLTDILNEKETFDNYGPEKLADWLKKSLEGLDSSSKYEQQLESDDKAVKISTIHKSKGLSYDIVLLPHANFSSQTESNIKSTTFHKDDDIFMSFYKTQEELDNFRFQAEQENRRLLYVAITRAIYKCIINFNNKDGTLNSFMHGNFSDNINIKQPLKETAYIYTPEDEKKIEKKPILFTGKIEDKWRLTSYSGLDIHTVNHSWEKEPEQIYKEEYENFIFRELPKGIQTGLIVHSLFEYIDFTDDTNWDKIIERTLKYAGRKVSKENIKKYKDLLKNTVNTTMYPNDFKLSDIENNKRFNELEFFFSFDNWKGNEIKNILPHVSISNQHIEGIMHGFIDLLFEDRGKFYILDWKTNYLGNIIEDYTQDKLEKAMTNNNYHLQYYIYTIAAKRFFEDRLPQFDYEKHFGGIYYLFIRGMRNGQSNGIFFTKPDRGKLLLLEKILTSPE